MKKTIILDFGSGNTNDNNWAYTKKMIDSLKKVDTGKHNIIIKWQLFKEAGNNVPLDWVLFKKAYQYAEKLGYKTTSSVFDKNSLTYLLGFDIPFVKIANNRNLDELIGEIPRKMPVYVSYGSLQDMKQHEYKDKNIKFMLCVSEYPATIEAYEKEFDLAYYASCGFGISDHTTDFKLYNKYCPDIVEWHVVLEHSEDNLDGGLFARTPESLKVIL